MHEVLPNFANCDPIEPFCLPFCRVKWRNGRILPTTLFTNLFAMLAVLRGAVFVRGSAVPMHGQLLVQFPSVDGMDAFIDMYMPLE
jgi:hypothetical protein